MVRPLLLAVAAATLAAGCGDNTGAGSAPLSTPNASQAQTHAVAACKAYQRPRQAAVNGHPYTNDAQIDAAMLDAKTESNLAATLDPRWQQLHDALTAITAETTGGKSDAAYTEFEAKYPVVRAQCMLAGAGDLSASLPRSGN